MFNRILHGERVGWRRKKRQETHIHYIGAEHTENERRRKKKKNGSAKRIITFFSVVVVIGRRHRWKTKGLAVWRAHVIVFVYGISCMSAWAAMRSAGINSRRKTKSKVNAFFSPSFASIRFVSVTRNMGCTVSVEFFFFFFSYSIAFAMRWLWWYFFLSSFLSDGSTCLPCALHVRESTRCLSMLRVPCEFHGLICIHMVIRYK